MEDKTIREQLDEIADEMCAHYCKYVELFGGEDPTDEEAWQLIEKHCIHCPITKLI